jgi:hypothetical protein
MLITITCPSTLGVRVSTAEVITVAISFAGLVFLGVQVGLARQALKETAVAQQQEWERQRKKASIDAIVATSKYREALKAVLPWNDRDPEEMANFLKSAGGDHAKLMPIREYLNHLEDIAVGVKQGVFDLETISMLEGSHIIDVAASYAPYIESVRHELRRSTIYEGIEYLAKLIEKHYPDLCSNRLIRYGQASETVDVTGRLSASDTTARATATAAG